MSGGTLVRPSHAFPQHTTSPPSRTAHTWLSPPSTCTGVVLTTGQRGEPPSRNVEHVAVGLPPTDDGTIVEQAAAVVVGAHDGRLVTEHVIRAGRDHPPGHRPTLADGRRARSWGAHVPDE